MLWWRESVIVTQVIFNFLVLKIFYNKIIITTISTFSAIKCKPNEILNPCPEYCTFEDTCEYKIYGAFKDCPVKPLDYKCQPRCDCKPGFVRIDTECEPLEKCNLT